MWVNHGPLNVYVEPVLVSTSVIWSCSRCKLSRIVGNIPTMGQFGIGSSFLLQHRKFPRPREVQDSSHGSWSIRRQWTLQPLGHALLQTPSLVNGMGRILRRWGIAGGYKPSLGPNSQPRRKWLKPKKINITSSLSLWEIYYQNQWVHMISQLITVSGCVMHNLLVVQVKM